MIAKKDICLSGGLILFCEDVGGKGLSSKSNDGATLTNGGQEFTGYATECGPIIVTKETKQLVLIALKH